MNISIITATFNAETVLKRAIQSVSSQINVQDIEHIIIDGQSTDGTLDIIKEQKKYISQWTSEKDKGIYDAMNKGIKMASGDIIGILNSDDFYTSNTILSKVLSIFEDPTIDACYGDLVYVDNQNTNLVIRYWKAGIYTSSRFYHGWMPPHPTFFVRRSIYEKYGLFNLSLGSAADYELMLRFLYKNKIKVSYIPETLVKMRVGGISNASLSNRIKANIMDRKAWKINNLKPYPWTLLAKPLRKIKQWMVTE